MHVCFWNSATSNRVQETELKHKCSSAMEEIKGSVSEKLNLSLFLSTHEKHAKHHDQFQQYTILSLYRYEWESEILELVLDFIMDILLSNAMAYAEKAVDTTNFIDSKTGEHTQEIEGS